jgi:hypothetical protein
MNDAVNCSSVALTYGETALFDAAVGLIEFSISTGGD